MTRHRIGTRKEWLQARLALLEDEKALTRRSDALALQRQQLPWVRLDKEYRFDTEAGSVSLADLFRGRSQLMIYHFMFGPDYTAGCPSCSAIADGFNGIVVHLENHDVAFAAVSRAPIGKLQAFRSRMGWSFDWVSSFSSDFNADFNVWFTEGEQREGGIEYNFRREPAVAAEEMNDKDSPLSMIAATAGTDAATFIRDRPGISAFIIEDGVIYHTYSSYSRGVDGIWGMYPWLDRAPKGRNETSIWWRHHDAYERTDDAPRRLP